VGRASPRLLLLLLFLRVRVSKPSLLLSSLLLPSYLLLHKILLLF
jgi:hypothetical protein